MSASLAPRSRALRLPIIGLLLLLMTMVFVIPLSIVFVEPGHGGVLWRRFGGGTVFAPAIGEGYHIIAPWDRLIVYDLRLQTWEASLQTLTSDGLAISLDVVLRYRPSPANLAYLHTAVGPDYVGKLIRPQVEAVVHELVALYPIEQVAGPLRTQIQRATLTALTDRSRVNSMGPIDPFTGADTPPLAPEANTGSDARRASSDGRVNIQVNSLNRALLLVQDILISRIVMPDRVRAAIEAKLEQNQRAQEYEYRLLAERAESERKVIEADGIRRFQETVSASLTPGYLTLRGIQATEALARSPNAKTIIIGGSNGLPLILNAGDGANAMAMAPAAAPLAEQQGGAPDLAPGAPDRMPPDRMPQDRARPPQELGWQDRLPPAGMPQDRLPLNRALQDRVPPDRVP